MSLLTILSTLFFVTFKISGKQFDITFGLFEEIQNNSRLSVLPHRYLVKILFFENKKSVSYS